MTIKEFKVQYALGTLTWQMKTELVNNPNTPVEILTKLSKDKDSYIRYWVAENPNTPKEVLERLLHDEDWIVRCKADRILEIESWMNRSNGYEKTSTNN